MLALLNWRIWVALAIALALTGACWKSYTAGQKSVRAEWNAEKLEQSKQSLRLVEKTIQDTAELQAGAEQTNGEKNAQIQALNSRVAALNTELRKRPQRPSPTNMPTTSADGKAASGCTGAQLYRSDAELLTRVGRDADELRIQLKACYVQYDAARTKFEAIKKD